MFKKMLLSVCGLAICAATVLTPAHAGLMIKQDFWGRNADNSLVLFAELYVDPAQAIQWNGNLYKAYGWNSFKLFNTDVAMPAQLFEAEFDMTNLQAGFSLLTFDVSDVGNEYLFWGTADVNTNAAFFDLRDANKAFDDPNSIVFTGQNIVTDGSKAVSSPATFGLLLLGIAGLFWRQHKLTRPASTV